MQLQKIFAIQYFQDFPKIEKKIELSNEIVIKPTP